MKKIFKAKDDCRGMSTGEIISTIFERRGIEDFPEFLHPTIDDLIPYEKLRNIENAFKIVDDGVNQEKSFLVYADVDTDGCSAGAIMYRYLRNFTNKVRITINEGKKHGIADYDIAKCDANIVIIVDSINDGEYYNKFIEAGKSVIVLDHHIIPDDINESIILVSSANDYPNPQLSGAGVTWKFCKYCDEMFLTDYADDLVDLAACGIIADMCDMSVPENRYICNWGFENLHSTGIKKINGSYEFDSQAVSFGIATLVNAANRMGLNEQALRLFLIDDKEEVASLIKILKSAKEQQNKIVSELIPLLNEQAQSQISNKVMSFIIDTEAGITGLVANKLLAEYQRPIFVLKKTDDNYTGSGRGIGVDDFRQLCENCGFTAQGHSEAFGVSINANNFHKSFNKLNDKLKDVEFVTTVECDAKIETSDITNDLVESVKKINKISGTGFPSIKFFITLSDYDVSTMSNGKHLKLTYNDILFIKWNYKGDIDEMVFNSENHIPVIISGTLSSSWFGRKKTTQFIIDELEVI